MLRPVRPLLPRRRVQPPLLRLKAARAAHEQRAMIDSQCNVHTTICVHQVGATAAQAGCDKETPISKKTKFEIEAQSFHIVYNHDIEGAFVDIDKSSISGFDDVQVLNFDINISSISYWVDIEVPALRLRFLALVLVRYRRLQPSTSKFLIIEAINNEGLKTLNL